MIVKAMTANATVVPDAATAAMVRDPSTVNWRAMLIDHLPKQLEAWHDFYLVVGTGAAALTGLLFVIVSLGPHVVAGHTQTGVRAFVSPIATHFTTVLVGSSLMLVPDLSMPILGTLLAVGGFGGLTYIGWTR